MRYNDVEHLVVHLDPAGNLHQSRTHYDLAISLHHIRPHHEVHNPRLILQGDETHPFGAAGALADQHDTGHLHPATEIFPTQVRICGNPAIMHPVA